MLCFPEFYFLPVSNEPNRLSGDSKLPSIISEPFGMLSWLSPQYHMNNAVNQTEIVFKLSLETLLIRRGIVEKSALDNRYLNSFLKEKKSFPNTFQEEHVGISLIYSSSLST